MGQRISNSFVLVTSTRTAAVTVGVAFLVSVIIVTLIDDFLLANFVVPGDIEALVLQIEADPEILLWSSIGYIVVLLLDAVIGVGLYFVLKPANQRLAALTGALRLLYAGALMAGVLAFLLQVTDVHGYAIIRLGGYVFFAFHILVLGFSVYLSGYIPKALGVLLIFAALSYVVFFVDARLTDLFLVLVMLTMALSETALCVWLILRRKRLPVN